jgi:4-aminobutyrate aminotransferase / (S)-3-amino-2-methylpropionate transaminase / 5-aminovalerate transaminase
MFTYTTSVKEKDDLNRLKMLEHASMRTDFYPLMWHTAEGAFVFNKDGDKWIDFTSAIAVANSGHSNRKVVEAIKDSLNDPLLTTYCFPHRYRLEIIDRLDRILKDSTGEEYGLHFMSSGTEAIEGSINIALDHHNQDESIIVSFYNAFHGNTLQSTSISGGASHGYFTFDDGRRVHYMKLPFQNRTKKTDSTSFRETLLAALDQYGLSPFMVAGVIVEPYQGKGVFVADTHFIKEIAAFCHANNALFIVDEIQSGFYRTSRRFAFEHFGVHPDIICLGKGLTSSLPMSAIAVKRKLFDKSANLDIATTHSANPMSCIAAIANIDFMENPQFKQHLHKISKYFENAITELTKRRPDIIAYSETFGMAGSIHIKVNDQHDSILAKKIVERCFNGGLLLSMPNGPYESYLRITPPLVIERDVLHRGMQILEKAIMKED